MNIEVGSVEAEATLQELLRGVQDGKRYTITLRGQAVADLVPAQNTMGTDAAAAAEEMRSFMQSRKPTSGVDVKALIDEGRA